MFLLYIKQWLKITLLTIYQKHWLSFSDYQFQLQGKNVLVKLIGKTTKRLSKNGHTYENRKQNFPKKSTQ